MKISISKSVLLPKLAQLTKVTDGKTITMLDDILFSVNNGALVMESGDGTISMSCTIDDLTIIKTGAATIPAKKLHEIVKKMGDVIELESIGLKVRVSSGKSKYELAGQEPEMYPTQKAVNGEQVTIKGSDFKDMVKRTAYAVSTHEGTPLLMGIKLRVKGSHMTATACDRHRLAEVSHKLEKGFTDVVSVVKGIAFKEFIGIIPDGEIEITFSDSNFGIKTADYSINLRVFDGNYPVTDKLVPQTFTTLIEVDVKEFKLALERALVVALDGKTNVLRMEVFREELTITAVSETNKASETLDAKVEGYTIIISFNGKYMVDALSTITAEKVTLHLNGNMSPIILKTDGTDDFQLILPYRTAT